VKIDERGNVSDARVLRGHPLLDEEALRAVKQWKYSPSLLNADTDSRRCDGNDRLQIELGRWNLVPERSLSAADQSSSMRQCARSRYWKYRMLKKNVIRPLSLRPIGSTVL